MGICYIVGAAEIYKKITPGSDDLVIAADGGYDRLVKMGVRPDLLIGDLDSIESELPRELEVIRHPIEKDETDSYLAYLEGRRRGYTKFELLGCTGGRDDHTFANYTLLLLAKNEGCEMTLVSERFVSFVIKNKRASLLGREGATVSAFAFGGECKGVSIRGLYYEAENISLSPESALCVSNHFTDKAAEIEVGEGALLVFAEKDTEISLK